MALLDDLTTAEIVSAIFVGYYNRAPAVQGRDRYIEDLEVRNQSPVDVARSFVPQSETTSIYPSITSAKLSEADAIKLVNDVFQNLFNKLPSKTGTDNFWVNKLLTEDGIEVGTVILSILNGAKGNDLPVIQNKINVATKFAQAAEAAGETGKGTLKDSILDGVDGSQASVDAALNIIADAYPVEPTGPVIGETINLTTAQDQPGGGVGAADTQGTADNDSYQANFSANGGGSLQATDNIVAAGGTDTLTVRVISTNGNETVGVQASDLENVVINTESDTSRFILDFVAITGETDVTAANNTTNGLTGFSNLDIGTNIRLVDNDGVILVGFKGDRSTSTDDTINLFVEDSGTADITTLFQTLTSNVNTGTVDTGFEIANINVGGTRASFLDLLGMELQSLIITGDQELFVEDNVDAFSTLQSVNASGMTAGGLNINAEGNTVSSFSFVGSGQADSLELNRALLENANTLSLNGGDGIDKLILNSVTNVASSVNATTSFEILETSGSISSLEANNFTNINTFIFDGQTSSSGRLNIRGVTNEDSFIFTSDQGQNDETVRFEGQTAGTFLRFELRAQSGTDGEIRIVTDSNSGNDNAAIGFTSNITSVEIVSSGSNAAANVIRAVDNNFNHFAFDNQNGPTNFTISGSQALTITAEAGVELDASSDERGFENAVNLNASGASGDLRIAGSSTADVIRGGEGNDILYGMGGDNVLTGNSGADQFRFSNFKDTSTLLDFTAGEDKIGLQRVDFGNTNASIAGTTLNADDYISNVSSITGMSNAESDRVVELQTALSLNQIESQEGGATESYILVFNSTSSKGELWFDDDWSDASNRTQTAVIDNIDSLAELTGLANTDFAEYLF